MDNWPGMEQDAESIARIKKSVELLDCKPGMTVFDIGCYRQVSRRFLPDCNYVGFDCESFCGDTIVRNLEDGFLWDSKADRILCLEVLEHLKTPSRTLSSIKTYLNPAGVAVVSLPNESTLFHRIRALLGTVDAECFGERGKHLHLPSLRQCREFLQQAGFEIVGERYYVSVSNSRQRWLSQLLRVIPKPFFEWLAFLSPALFARGFIFKIRASLLP